MKPISEPYLLMMQLREDVVALLEPELVQEYSESEVSLGLFCEFHFFK